MSLPRTLWLPLAWRAVAALIGAVLAGAAYFYISFIAYFVWYEFVVFVVRHDSDHGRAAFGAAAGHYGPRPPRAPRDHGPTPEVGAVLGDWRSKRIVFPAEAPMSQHATRRRAIGLASVVSSLEPARDIVR